MICKSVLVKISDYSSDIFVANSPRVLGLTSTSDQVY